MAPIVPQFSKKAVSRAGDILISAHSESDEYKGAIEVINNWRESHDFPLRVIRNALRKRANQIAKSANVAARLKRLPSIHSKLVRPESKGLSSMQDIGGCRVIFKTVEEVYDLLEVYLKEQSRNPSGRTVCIKFVDYILHPKESGYRSLHLILKYQSLVESCIPFTGHKIEIQIRSQLQHHWATAVETASTFLGEGLKSSSGDFRWLRFFALAGSVFAIIEGRQPVPNTPSKQVDLVLKFEIFGTTFKSTPF